jgi:nitrite reductase/ring-hydroxylating ferredoxin subunit
MIEREVAGFQLATADGPAEDGARRGIEPASCNGTEKIRPESWACVCHLGDLGAPGAFVATWIGDQPVVVLRDAAGRLRALSNRCLHRGLDIMRGEGNAHELLCRYHGWTYGLGGNLVEAPQMRWRPELKECRLPSFGLATWNGFVFVALGRPGAETGDVPALELGDGALAEVAARRLAVVDRSRTELAGAWRRLIGHALRRGPAPDPAAAPVERSRGTGTTLSVAWRDGVCEAEAARFGLIAPNMLVALGAEWMQLHVMRPLAAERTEIVSYSLCPAVPAEEPGWARWIAESRCAIARLLADLSAASRAGEEVAEIAEGSLAPTLPSPAERGVWEGERGMVWEGQPGSEGVR